MDQAQKLRDIVNFTDEYTDENVHDAKLISVSSGKGGVGKTNFTLNLGISLAKLGKRVTVIDADLGLANVDVLLGIVPKYNLWHVIRGEKSIDEISLEGPEGIRVISGGSGITELVDLSDEDLSSLIESFLYLNQQSDYILIDTGAGISKSVLSFVDASQDVIVIVTPDPTSITDAYALIKNISTGETSVKVVINRVDSSREGDDIFNKINIATKKFLSRDLENIGYIYEDTNVRRAVKKQNPFVIAYPNSIAAKGVDLIAYNLVNHSHYVNNISGFKSFINKLINKL